MANLVTLEETKVFLRVDHDDDDTTIAIMIGAASDAVRDVATDWNGEGEVPDRIKLAVLSRVQVAFDNNGSVEPASGELRLLTPLRSMEV